MTGTRLPALTHYDVLEVSPLASAPTIRAAYKSLMQRYHPDRAASTDTKSQAQRINAAYEVLSDAQRRRRYDAELAGSRVPPRVVAGPTLPAAPSSSRIRRVAGEIVTLLFLLVGIGAWWWAMPPAQWHVGTVQYDAGSPVVQVVARIVTTRDAQGIAQAKLIFRTADRRPFRVNGQTVAIGSSLVRFDCTQRRFNSSQNRMVLADGSVVDLVDSIGVVTPRSASERAMELACSSWWRRWNLR